MPPRIIGIALDGNKMKEKQRKELNSRTPISSVSICASIFKPNEEIRDKTRSTRGERASFSRLDLYRSTEFIDVVTGNGQDYAVSLAPVDEAPIRALRRGGYYDRDVNPRIVEDDREVRGEVFS